MRKIKFKAKRLYNDEWVEGYFYEWCNDTYIIEDRQSESMLNRNCIYIVDPDTVCQFTGLKDEYGAEIWEHDILASSPGFKGEVVFFNGCFCVKDDDGSIYPFSSLRIIDGGIDYRHVIGNKFNSKEVENE